MAANTNLITSFIRRISKYFDSSNFTWQRPKRVAPGANHIDNPTDFDARTIYRGEEIVDFTKGKLYTQDGGEIVELNSPSQIIDGLRTVNPSVVGAFGGGALYVSVESGAVRINGKNYYHESAGGTAVNGDITIAPNASLSKGRIDIIAAKSDYPNPAPAGIVGTFGVDSTEYAAGLTAIAGTLYNQGRALTFTGDYPGTGNTITINSVLAATAISAGDAIIGPNISGTVTVSSVTTSGGLITSIDISATPVAASTSATYAISTYLGDVYAIKGDISAGSNTIVNVFPQPLVNDLIIGQGIPNGTIATNVATPGTVVLSNSATLTTTESLFQIGDVVDHILYDATTPWPNLPDDHVLLGLVYVPNSYTISSVPNTLRPWSVSEVWNSNNIENQTTKSLVNYYLSTIQEYTSDTTYMSGNTIIDPQTQSIARVIKNHYSSDLGSSLSAGMIVQVSSNGAVSGGVTGATGATGTAGVDGANSSKWYFNELATAPTNPGTKLFCVDNSDPTLVTNISINDLNYQSIDLSNWLSLLDYYSNTLNTSVILQISETTNSINTAVYTIAPSSVTVNVGYVDILVSHVGGASFSFSIGGTTEYTISFVANGLDGATGTAGATGPAGSGYYQYASNSAQLFMGGSKVWVKVPDVGKKLVIGLYDVISGNPTNLLWQTSEFDTSLAGLYTYTHPSPVLMPKGLYVIGYHLSGTPTVRVASTAPSYGQSVEFIGMEPTLSFTDNFFVTWRGALAYNATMPSTWPVGSVRYVGNDSRIPLIIHIIQ